MNNVSVNRVFNNRLTGPWKSNINNMLNARGRHFLVNYFNYTMKNKNLIKYAATNTSGKIYGFALLKNEPNSRTRKLLLISSKSGYGSAIMRKISENASRNNRNFINLEALNQSKLVNFYKSHGFQHQFKNRNNLHHMTKRMPRMARVYLNVPKKT